MTDIAAPSAITRMLSDISWEGRLVTKKYRDGGRQKENVLTTEVFHALQYLPRIPFISAVVATFNSEFGRPPPIDESEVQTTEFEVFPSGTFALRPTAPNHQEAIDVQIDAMISTVNSFVCVEAKRIQGGQFQTEQLARTYLVTLRESADRRPIVLFLLGREPPVKVKGVGRVSIRDGILSNLSEVYAKCDGLNLSLAEAQERLDETVFWTTWSRIADAIQCTLSTYSNPDSSTEDAVRRLANSILTCVEWHG